MDSEKYLNFILENKLPINIKDSIDIPSVGYLIYPFKDFNPLKLTLNIISATGLSTHLTDVIAEWYTKYIIIKSKK